MTFMPMEAAAIGKWTKGSIITWKAHAASHCTAQFFAVTFLTPSPLLKFMPKIAQKTNGIREMPLSEGSPHASYKVFVQGVCMWPMTKFASKQNHSLCLVLFEEQAQHSSSSSFALCTAGCWEPGDPACGTNPVPQVFKQACCQFSSAAIPVWPESLWTKSGTSW